MKNSLKIWGTSYSYILKRTEQNYSYTIPLFQRYLQGEDIEAIMREKIEEFRRKYGEM